MTDNKEETDNNSDFILAETSEEEKEEIRSMTGNKKVWNYFLDLVKDTRFQDQIGYIKKHNLDKGGSIKNIDKLRNAVKILCRNFGLDEMMWVDELQDYIVKDKLPKENLSTPCIIFDRMEMGENEYPDGCYEDPYDEGSCPKKPVELEPWSYSHPIIIRVNPYASQREIIDYIKKSYARRIRPLQECYQSEMVYLGKVRRKNKNITERNEFIWANRHLPRKDIMKLLNDKYGWDNRDKLIDYAYIGKIISLEKRKRENK